MEFTHSPTHSFSLPPSGPTPDWIVGVSALELCLANCSWVGQKMLNLYPWDAGTDSGITYEVGRLGKG